MIKWEKEYQEIKKIIINLLESVEAEMVVIVDKNGQQVVSHCQSAYFEEQEVLDFLETRIVETGVDREIVKIKNNTIYIYLVNDGVRLVVVSNKEQSNRISLLVLRASRQLNTIFEFLVSNLQKIKDDDEFSNPSNNSSSSSGSGSCPVFYRYYIN